MSNSRLLHRYHIFTDHPDLRGHAIHWEGEMIGPVWIGWVHGFQEMHDDCRTLPEAVHMVTSLEADATQLPPKVLTFLANRGIVPQPGDKVLNVLRAFRDQFGSKLDISHKNA
jgi:hypothetical protein